MKNRSENNAWSLNLPSDKVSDISSFTKDYKRAKSGLWIGSFFPDQAILLRKRLAFERLKRKRTIKKPIVIKNIMRRKGAIFLDNAYGFSFVRFLND